MLQSALVLVAAGGAVAQTYPDQLDILRGADTTPQIELVLDTSGSMGPSSPNLPSACDWHYAQYISSTPDPNNPMTRLELLKAVLTGCRSATDGILDTWANKAIFAVREFGTNPPNNTPRTDLRANFFGGPTDAQGIPIGSNLPNLEAAILGLQPEGYTPLVRAYELAARHFGADFDASNSRHCRQNYIVLMTDGDGNWSATRTGASRSSFDFVAGQPTLSVADANGCYLSGGCGSFTPPFADEAATYLVRDASGNIVDALPNVPDTPLPAGGTRGQPIRTYTIAFDPPGDSLFLLLDMALNGEGFMYTATSYQQLYAAFENIISSIVPRAQVAFSPGTVQNDGLFSGNFLYVPTFQPVENGHWFGTLKKHCVMPASATDLTCLFREDTSGNLITNPQVLDDWTNTSQPDATVGGSGQQIFSQLFGVSGPSGSVPANPYSYRNIMTWRPIASGSGAYIPVNGSTSFDNNDTHTSNLCEHYKLLNKLHGFTAEVTDCAAANYAPTGFDTWPQGDTANGGTVLLKYTDECESATSQCYVVTNANDGMLHVFRGRDGTELSAVIPGELWGPTGVNHNQLRDIMDQPNLDLAKRYFFDGGVRLFHQDQNANGYIDSSETAYLIAGLGRAGYGYYLWDVSSFNGDFSNVGAPGPRTLLVDEATGFRNLRETWAAPWVGLMRNSSGSIKKVAAFPSGHMRELDGINNAFGVLERGLDPLPTDTESSPHTMTCSAFGLDAQLCAPPLPASGCTPCTFAVPTSTSPALCPPVTPPTTAYCYDWPGYAGDTSVAPFDNGQPSGHDILFGPFSWAQNNQSAVAYRVVFNRFELQANDYMEFQDANQLPVGRLTGNGLGSATPCSGAACGPWIYSPSFNVRLVSDGNDSSGVTAWEVGHIEIIRSNDDRVGRNAGGFPPIVANYTRPSVFFVDLDVWAGFSPFLERPTGSDTRQGEALLVRITSNCDGLTAGNEICIDETGSGGQAAQPDLAYMTCPISAELAVYQEGNVFRSAYVGDECGQIWKFDQATNGQWTVQRILRLNLADANGRVIPNQRSEDYRKIFSRLELVLSRCNGSRSIGVYFGSGNMQRAGSLTGLSDPTITRFPGTGVTGPNGYDANVIGVVWDSANLPRPSNGLSLADLANVTSVIELSNTTTGNAANGFFIELNESAKALRPPVVFDAVASFKVYQPTTAATECVSAMGEDTIYQFDNCTAAPIADSFADTGNVIGDTTNDRLSWRGQTDIGGGLLVFTPKSGDAFVSAADTNASSAARLPGRPNSRAMRVYLWRTEVELQ